MPKVSTKQLRQLRQGKQKAWRLHETTATAPTGAGGVAAKRPGKSSKGDIWDASQSLPCPEGICRKPLAVSKGEVIATAEVLRLAKVTKLRSLLSSLCAELGVVEPLLAFERWLIRAQFHSPVQDELLPTTLCDRLLADDLQRAGATKAAATRVAKKLGEASAAAVAQLRQHFKAESKRGRKSKGCAGPAKYINMATHTWTVDVFFPSISDIHNSKRFLKLNRLHLNKLKSLYQRFSGDVESSEFRFRLFAMLCRYHALLGHGFQAAISEHAFQALKRSLGVTFECFASPLNCNQANYCSAFPEVDAYFGSVGSFFGEEFAPVEGSFEANPPFEAQLMSAMGHRIHHLLHASTRALSFCVVVPGWTEMEAWSTLSSSPYLRAKWLISKDDHGFCDGAQHQRRDRYRTSPYDSAVFILQTDSAALKWPASAEVERTFREALAESVPTDAARHRRLRDGRGAADEDGGGMKKERRRTPKRCAMTSSDKETANGAVDPPLKARKSTKAAHHRTLRDGRGAAEEDGGGSKKKHRSRLAKRRAVTSNDKGTANGAIDPPRKARKSTEATRHRRLRDGREAAEEDGGGSKKKKHRRRLAKRCAVTSNDKGTANGDFCPPRKARK